MFIINEENYFNILITDKLKTDIKNISTDKFIETEEIIDKIESDNLSYWFEYKNYSFRYDSFLFLFYSTIYHKIKDANFIHKSNNISDLLNLLGIIVNKIKNGKNNNIWDICNINPSVSLDILNQNNGYIEYYPIHHLFDWFKGDNFFTISYTNMKSCIFCFKNDTVAKNTEPLIPISISELLNFSSLSDILYNKLGVKQNSSSLCSYETNGIIKSEDKYKKCETNLICNVILPIFLLFVFDLSSVN